MNPINDRLLIVFPIPGERDAAASMQTLITVGDRRFEQLAPLDLEAVAELAPGFNLDVIAENNELRSKVAGLEKQLVDLEALREENEKLKNELEAIRNPPGPDLSTADGVKTYLAAVRYQLETGGIFIEGQPITTAREHMAYWFPRFFEASQWLAGDAAARANKPEGLFAYKPLGGASVVLSAAQIVRAYQCLAWFVEQCFIVELHLQNQVDSGAALADVLAAIDRRETWPPNNFLWTPPEAV